MMEDWVFLKIQHELQKGHARSHLNQCVFFRIQETRQSAQKYMLCRKHTFSPTTLRSNQPASVFLGKSSLGPRKKKTLTFHDINWLFYRDPYNGLSSSLCNWVGFHPLYNHII